MSSCVQSCWAAAWSLQGLAGARMLQGRRVGGLGERRAGMQRLMEKEQEPRDGERE